jgi:hypothetical protein
MNLTLQDRRLWWKELRQLMPLVMLLLILVPVMLLLYFAMQLLNGSQFSSPQSNVMPLYFVLGLPGLFGIGVGGILIGQERELRTLQWLSNLPIAPSRLINGKLYSSLFAMGMLWLICIPIALAIFPSGITQSSSWQNIAFWVAYSVFLLIWSLAINWRVQGVFASLLLMVPIAIVPSILFSFIETSVRKWKGINDPLVDMLCIALLLFLSLAGWLLVQRFGLAALAPERIAGAPTSTDGAVHELSSSRYRSTTELAGYHQQLKPMSALCWQAYAQHSGIYCLLFGLLVLAGCFATYELSEPIGPGRRSSPMGVAISQFLHLLAASWLGILAFQGDSHLRRALFLSERGISPAVVWLTRHTWGVTIMLLYLALFIPAAIWFSSDPVRTINAVTFVAFVLFTSYTVSQWIGQLIRGPIASAILAPIAAFLLFSAGVFYLEYIGSSSWIVALVGLIPWIATWLGKSSWMDQRTRVVGWFGHGLALVLMSLLPILPGLLTICQTPRMSRCVEVELTSLGRMNPPSFTDNYLHLNGPSFENETNNRDKAALTTAFDFSKPDSLAKLNREELRLLVHNSGGQNALSLQDEKVTGFLISYAVLTRLSWKEKSPDDESLKSYRSSLSSIHQIVRRARLSSQLIDQDRADQLEIFLLEELQLPAAQKHLGENLFREIASGLADRKVRQNARKQALASSFVAGQDFNAQYFFGAYTPPSMGQTYKWLPLQIQLRKNGLALEDLWYLLHSEPDAIDSVLVKRIANFWQTPVGAYLCLSNTKSTTAAENYLAIKFQRTWIHAPALSWHGKWEREAEELLSRYTGTKE